MRNVIALIVCATLALGCTSISKDAQQQLDKPVDCATAEQDIATLESEKAGVAKRVASGVRMVVPAALVLGILRRDMRNRAKVAAGQYNADIEAKIAEIRKTCG